MIREKEQLFVRKFPDFSAPLSGRSNTKVKIMKRKKTKKKKKKTFRMVTVGACNDGRGILISP
jgi:hypothetical protein